MSPGYVQSALSVSVRMGIASWMIIVYMGLCLIRRGDLVGPKVEIPAFLSSSRADVMPRM